MGGDVIIEGISGDSIVKIKLKSLLIFLVSIFTFMGTVAGWLMSDYSKKIESTQTKVEKMDEKIDQISLDIQYIRGQLKEMSRPSQSEPTNIHPPLSTAPPEN